MIDCMIIGDSIAVGTQMFRKECVAYAAGGINSSQWNKKYRTTDLTAGTVIISLGTNDHDGVNSFRELLAMRERVTAERVYWIMPVIKPHIQDMVQIIAKNFDDTIITTNRLQSDKIHPSWAGYKELSNATRDTKR